MQDNQYLISITAVIASCNEGHKLKRCLAGLGGFFEIIVVDLVKSKYLQQQPIKSP